RSELSMQTSETSMVTIHPLMAFSFWQCFYLATGHFGEQVEIDPKLAFPIGSTECYLESDCSFGPERRLRVNHPVEHDRAK
ncbi:MAG: hypothetical protein ACPIA2_19215, partial [Mariniblastus sp.]